MREAPTRPGPLFTRRKAQAPKRLKANSRSLQRLMLRRREPNRSYHEKSLCVAALAQGQEP
jgi:hypothetical protein